VAALRKLDTQMEQKMQTNKHIPPLHECYHDDSGISFIRDGNIVFVPKRNGSYVIDEACEIGECSFDTPAAFAAFEADVRAACWFEVLRGKLSEAGHDPKYLDQIVGKLLVEKVASLDDAEIERAFDQVVLSDFCIQYAKKARDLGLTLDHLYPEAAQDPEIPKQDDEPSPM